MDQQQQPAAPPTRYSRPVPQRIICTRCDTNYVQHTAILPENHQGQCRKCGGETESLGRIAR